MFTGVASSAQAAGREVQFWGSEQGAAAPTQMTADLDYLDDLYSKYPHSLTVGNAEKILATSDTYKKLYDADNNLYPSLASFFEWLQQFGRGQIPNGVSNRLANAMVAKAKNDAKAAITKKLDGYISDLEAAKGKSGADANRIQAVIDNLTDLKNSGNIDPTNPDVAANIAAATQLAKDPSSKPDVPGYSGNVPTEDKTDAINDLQEKYTALKTFLEAHPENSVDLSAEERQAAETARDKAKAALDNANGYSVDQLTALANETQAATDAATKAVTDNRATARTDLGTSLAAANTLSADPSLPADAKATLDRAIAAAKTVSDDPNSTTTQLREAKATLDQAIATAQAARDKAVADAKKALSDKLGAAQAVASDPNLTGAEKEALDEAIRVAKEQIAKGDANVPDINAAGDALDAALTNAKNKIAADKDAAAKKVAADELKKQVDALNGFLGTHNTGNKNLTPEQHQAGTDDARAGQEVLNAYNTDKNSKSAKELQDAAKAVADALKTAQAQVAANKQAAHDALMNEADMADVAVKSGHLLQEDLAALQEKIKQARNYPAGNEVAAQEAVQLALRQAVEDAADRAEKALEVAKAELEEMLPKLRTLRDANMDNENLTADEIAAINAALEAGEASKNSADPNEVRTALNNTIKAYDDALKAIGTNKAGAVAGLASAVDALEKYLAANPESTENLDKNTERAEAVQALDAAKAKLTEAKAGTLSVKEINEAATAANEALGTAKTQVAANQAEERGKLNAAIAAAKENPGSDASLPQEAKIALDEAIAKAQAVSDNANASVKELKDAQDALAQAVQTANEAKTQAIADSKSKLQSLIDAMTELLEGNPASSKNLSADERKAAEDALTAAKAAAENPDGQNVPALKAAAKALDEATKKADAQVTSNKDTARKALGSEIDLAKALAETDMPEDVCKELQDAITAAEAVKGKEASTVDAMENAAKALKIAEDKAAKAAKDAKQAQVDVLDAAIKQLEEALAANPEDSENLTAEERATAEAALADAKLMRGIVDDPEVGLTIAEVKDLARKTVEAANTVVEQANANKVQPRADLNQGISELDDFLAANPEASKNLTAEQRAAAEAALADARKIAGNADSTVAQLKESLEKVRSALTKAQEQAAANQAAARDAMAKALEAAKARLDAPKLTAASRDALAKAIAKAEALGEDATVADLEAATTAVDKGVKEAQNEADAAKDGQGGLGGLAKTGASLAALPLALGFLLMGSALVRRRRRA